MFTPYVCGSCFTDNENKKQPLYYIFRPQKIKSPLHPIKQNAALCYYTGMIDLHTHSTASDGLYSPTQLVELAVSRGLTALALTDHDTVHGIAEAETAARSGPITFIPGIELHIEWHPGEFHLLGLGLTGISQKLTEIISHLEQGRKSRNQEVIQRMKADGFPVSEEEITELYPDTIIGRPHIAAYLAGKQIVKTRQKAFDLYLAQGRPYYIERKGAQLTEAIEAVVSSGGVPVLAHPLSLYLSWSRLDSFFAEIKEQGIAGIEAWHPGARAAECERLEKLAREHGFFVTAGSDFHGEQIRPDRKLGYTAGGAAISDRFFTQELNPYLAVRTEAKH